MPGGGKIPAAIFVSQRPNESAKDCAAAESSHEKRCILLSRESSDCSHGKAIVPGSPTNWGSVYSGFSPGTTNGSLKHTRDSRQATVGCIECIHKWPLQPICHHCTEVGLRSAKIWLLAACMCHLWTIWIPKFSQQC